MEKKLKLIEALEHERDLFDKRHQDTTDHDMAINYLKHVVFPSIVHIYVLCFRSFFLKFSNNNY